MIIETERLYFREITESDYPDLCVILQDEEVMYAWEHGFSDEEVTNWINECLKRYDSDGYSYNAVILKSNNKLIGLCGIISETADNENYLGVGYIFNKNYWHKGYAFESASACMNYAFNILKANEVTAQIRPENISSRKIAEKLGMTVKKQFIKRYQNKDMPHLIFSVRRSVNDVQQYGPNPNKIYPNENIKQVCLIKNIIKNPNIQVGDYTYYDNANGSEDFESHVTHHYDFIGDKLIIGKFCAIAKGIEFVMNGANHRMNSVTTYPFNIMGNGWEKLPLNLNDLPLKGDTIIGNDVWIGQNVTVMPGIHVGDGAIIAANSVVVKDVPAYHIVGGNPAKIIRKRFEDELIEYLLQIKWWDWTAEKIFNNLEILCSSDVEKIKNIR